MPSRRNRSGKSNKRSLARLAAWLEARRGLAIAAGFVLLFGVAAPGGYWLAQLLEPRPQRAVYGSIADIPGLPRYSETDPDHKQPTLDEAPRPRLPPSAIAATEEPPAWRRNAVPFRDPGGQPLIAIVIDDVGLDRQHSRRAWELPGPLTMSFLPYARDLREQAKAARARGHELMLHLPMEPAGRADPGPNALLVSLSDDELRKRVLAALDSFDGYVGVNNHMGSRFTAYRPGMEAALRLFKARGLLFLDSRTTAQTVGDQIAQEIGLPSVTRHVFLDDDDTTEAVRRKLLEAEAVARRQGFAVAIGHPHDSTVQALAEWLPTVGGKGLAVAPLSAVLRRRNGWD